MNQKNTTRRGYALPTILIMSLAILTVIAALLATTSSSFRDAVDQHYQTLADEAAEAGTAYATSCLTSTPGHVARWGSDNARPNLTPNGDCTGSSNSNCSNATVYADTSVRTCFSVGNLKYTTDFAAQTESTGYAVVMSGGNVMRTYTRVLMKVQTWPTGVTSSSVSSGMYFTCAVVNNDPWCFGHNGVGQLGNGQGYGDSFNNQRNSATSVDSFFPTRVSRILVGNNATLKIAAGGYHACLLTLDGQVYCWGLNIFGQLGNGSTSDSTVPVKANLPTSDPVTDIVVSEFNTCAIAGGKVYCWGRTNEGVVGNNCTIGGWSSTCNSPGYVSTPTQVVNGDFPPDYTATKLSTSGGAVQNVCAIASGSAYCWGVNDYGQIGDGTTTDRSVPTAVSTSGVLSGQTVESISLGGHGSIGGTLDIGVDTHVCAIAKSSPTSNGIVYCWGRNNNYQVGDGSTTTRKTPVSLANSGAIKGLDMMAIRVGSNHSCALSNLGGAPALGNVYCWGQNTYGQTGNGSYSTPSGTSTSPPVKYTKTPTAVNANADEGLPPDVTANLGGGVNRACAITAEQIVYCWGVNYDGQVGDGSSGNYKMVPIRAAFLDPTNNRFMF